MSLDVLAESHHYLVGVTLHFIKDPMLKKFSHSYDLEFGDGFFTDPVPIL